MTGILDQATLESRIYLLFTVAMNVPVPNADTDLIAEGFLDSLVFVDLLFRLEKEFGFTIAIDTLETEELRSVRMIAAFVRTRMARD